MYDAYCPVCRKDLTEFAFNYLGETPVICPKCKTKLVLFYNDNYGIEDCVLQEGFWFEVVIDDKKEVPLA